ncbi:hypothetical protein DFAR_1620001 [Desulfarculales bacterium]
MALTSYWLGKSVILPSLLGKAVQRAIYGLDRHEAPNLTSSPRGHPHMANALDFAWVAAASRLVDDGSYSRLQSMHLKELTPGGSGLEIDLAQNHLQPFGLAYGGVLATMVDAAGFWALYTFTDPGLGLTTVKEKRNFLRRPCMAGLGPRAGPSRWAKDP